MFSTAQISTSAAPHHTGVPSRRMDEHAMQDAKKTKKNIMPAMASSRPESEPLSIQLLVDSIPALIHTSRPDGYLDYFNKPWLEYLGVTLAQMAGWNWTAYIH